MLTYLIRPRSPYVKKIGNATNETFGSSVAVTELPAIKHQEVNVTILNVNVNCTAMMAE